MGDDAQGFDGIFNAIFDVVTWRSPLRREAVRRVVSAVSPALIGSADPSMVALGLGLKAMTALMEARFKKRSKK